MVVRMRHTRGHTGNRRSHHGLSARALSLCKDCGSPRLPHRACPNCGRYKGRVVIDVAGAAEKKAAKAKAKSQEASK